MLMEFFGAAAVQRKSWGDPSSSNLGGSTERRFEEQQARSDTSTQCPGKATRTVSPICKHFWQHCSSC